MVTIMTRIDLLRFARGGYMNMVGMKTYRRGRVIRSGEIGTGIEAGREKSASLLKVFD